jgi:hypothetical protein
LGGGYHRHVLVHGLGVRCSFAGPAGESEFAGWHLLRLVIARGLRVLFRSTEFVIELFVFRFHLALLLMCATTGENHTGVGFRMHFVVVGRNCMLIGLCMHIQSVGGTCRVIEACIIIIIIEVAA